jgi:hypothetical protein
MSAAIVRRDDLDILSLPATTGLLVFDADVREVDLVIEVRQVMFVSPPANLIGRPIGVAVVVILVLVVLVQPALIVTLQFVIQDDTPDARAAVVEPRLGLLVRAIDLEVVLQLARACEARVERLAMIPIGVPVTFEKAAACPG